MPILRREETPDTLAPRLLYIWDKKLWVILPTIAVFILGYLAMRFVPESFEAKASIFVNKLTPFSDKLRDPDTVAELMRGSDVLANVRDQYAKRFNVAPPQLEKFVKQFKSKTSILQDTAVRKDVSPVVELTVQATGRDQTLFLMQEWIRVFVRDMGNYGVMEAKQKVESLSAEDSRINAALTEAETSQARLIAELPLQEKLLAEQMDLLAPAEFRRPGRLPNTSIEGSAQNTQVLIDQPSASKAPGLVTRLALVRLDLARSRGGAAGTSSTADLEREETALTSVIEKTRASIATAQKTVADLQQQLATVTRTITVETGRQRQLHKFLDDVNVEAAMAKAWTEQDPLRGGDLRVISQPVLPDVRVWPKRTLIAAALAAATFVLCVIALQLNQYLAQLGAREQRAKP